MTRPKAKTLTNTQRIGLNMKVSMAKIKYGIEAQEIADELKMSKSSFSHMMAGRRPILLLRFADDIAAIVQRLSDEAKK